MEKLFWKKKFFEKKFSWGKIFFEKIFVEWVMRMFSCLCFCFAPGFRRNQGITKKFTHHDGNISLSFPKLIYLGKYG